MTGRALSAVEQDFLSTLQKTLLEHPQPLELDQHRSQALIAMILAATRQASPAEGNIGPVCQTPALAEWLGISRQGVNKGVRERRILGVQIGRAWHYPTWQLGPHQILPAATRLFKHVLPAAPSALHLTSLAAWAWEETPAHSRLSGLSPASWIQQERDIATLLTYADESWSPELWSRQHPPRYVAELAS